MVEIKSRKITKKEIEYYVCCKYCKKEIKGYTPGQVEYNLGIHIKAKHKDKEVIKNE